MTEIATAGVVGLGTMGAGIVEVFARTGIKVVAVEIDDAALQRGQGILESSVQRAVDKGRVTEEAAQAIRDAISWTTVFDDLADVDLVIEAVPERIEIKRDLMGRLDALCKPSTILATNTSSLSVTQIAATTTRPDRVIGMHFFNPAPVMKLVEVITTVLTDAAVADAVQALASQCGKAPVVIGDRAGFVANTLLIGYLNEAVRLFDSTTVTREGIDDAMRLGANLPMGPLALCDLIGIDVVVEILDVLMAESGDPVHAAAPLLRAMKAAGLLGRKTGRGFYTYAKPGSSRVEPDAATPAPRANSGHRPRAVLVAATAHADELTAAAKSGDWDLTVVQPGDLAAIGDDIEVVLVEVTPTQRLHTSVVALAAGKERVVGIHPLHRGPNGLAIEVVAGPLTSATARGAALDLVALVDGTAVVCDDTAGLVVGRLLTVYLNDAVRMAASGYASTDDIDTAMRLGCGYPIGPFAFLAMMGAAAVTDTLDQVHESTGFARHVPVPALRDARDLSMSVADLLARG